MNQKWQSLINWPEPGKYIVAVSGGVDSVALLDLLVHKNEGQWGLIVAHVDHGWRPGDAERELVEEYAKLHRLHFKIEQLKPVKPSEDAARRERYRFLAQAMEEEAADAIITAHHRDDLIETVVMRAERGGGRLVLSPFNQGSVIRPLLNVWKKDLINYARSNHLKWTEDPTNLDAKYHRNRIRIEKIPALRSRNDRFDQIIDELIKQGKDQNQEINQLILSWLEENGQSSQGRYEVGWPALRRLSPEVLSEILLFAFRKLTPGQEFDSNTIEQLVWDLKLGRLRSVRQVGSGLFVTLARDTVIISV
jgi:tRNA(Ile)-lysidine synthase